MSNTAPLFQWCVVVQSWLDQYDNSQNPGKISNSSLLTKNGIIEILLDKEHGKDFGLISPREWDEFAEKFDVHPKSKKFLCTVTQVELKILHKNGTQHSLMLKAKEFAQLKELCMERVGMVGKEKCDIEVRVGDSWKRISGSVEDNNLGRYIRIKTKPKFGSKKGKRKSSQVFCPRKSFEPPPKRRKTAPQAQTRSQTSSRPKKKPRFGKPKKQTGDFLRVKSDDLVVKIFKFLPAKELPRISQTCRYFNNFITKRDLVFDQLAPLINLTPVGDLSKEVQSFLKRILICGDYKSKIKQFLKFRKLSTEEKFESLELLLSYLDSPDAEADHIRHCLEFHRTKKTKRLDEPKLTDEQKAVIQRVKSMKSGCLRLFALAGCGKTATLRALAKALPNPTIYLAFNKSVISAVKHEGIFDEPRTFSSVGLKYLKTQRSITNNLWRHIRNSSKLKGLFDYLTLDNKIDGAMRVLGWGPRKFLAKKRNSKSTKNVTRPMAYVLIEFVNRYVWSADKDISLIKHIPKSFDSLRRDLEDESYQMQPDWKKILYMEARNLWKIMKNPSSVAEVENYSLTFNGCLKLMQLEALHTGPFDLAEFLKNKNDNLPFVIMIDECQDLSECLSSILQNQKNVVIFCGDGNQEIYQFAGSCGFFRHTEEMEQLTLTQNFRFGHEFKCIANWLLDQLIPEKPQIRLKALKETSLLEKFPGYDNCRYPLTVLGRTLGDLYCEAYHAITKGLKVHVVAAEWLQPNITVDLFCSYYKHVLNSGGLNNSHMDIMFPGIQVSGKHLEMKLQFRKNHGKWSRMIYEYFQEENYKYHLPNGWSIARHRAKDKDIRGYTYQELIDGMDAGFIQRPDLYKYLRLVENFQVECFEAVRTLNRTLINALEPNASSTTPMKNHRLNLAIDTGVFTELTREIFQSVTFARKDDTWYVSQSSTELVPKNSRLMSIVSEDGVSFELRKDAISKIRQNVEMPGTCDIYYAKFAQIELSTVHKCKGCEWDTVKLCDDFGRGIEKIFEYSDPQNEGELPESMKDPARILYVAATRAKKVLYMNSPVMKISKFVFPRRLQFTGPTDHCCKRHLERTAYFSIPSRRSKGVRISLCHECAKTTPQYAALFPEPVS